MVYRAREPAMSPAAFRKLLDAKNLSLSEAAQVGDRHRTVIQRYLNGEVSVDAAVVARIMATRKRKTKSPPGRRWPKKNGAAR